MNADDGASLAIDEYRRLDIIKVVADAEDVVTAGSMAFEASCVDCLDLTEFMNRDRQPQQNPPEPHFEILFPRTNDGEIRQLIYCKAEFSNYSRRFV